MRRGILGSIVLAATVATATAALAGTRVYVAIAPPAPRAEVRVVAPGPGYLWIGGFYRWSGAAYVWVPGRWALPPRPHAVWVAGHWKHHGGHGWYWVEGRWK